MYYALLTVFVIVALLLLILTLVQKGRGDVGSAFGSGMGQTIFGAGGVETILTKATYWLGGVFLVLAILLSLVPRGEKGSVVEERLRDEGPPAAQTGGPRPQEGRPDNTGAPAEGKGGGTPAPGGG
jgi:preprotein translocase subunit SecG